METEIQKIRREAQELYKSLSRIDKEGFETWENDPSYSGYGYKVILDTTWIDIGLIINHTTPSEVVIRLYEKNQVNPNVFDFLCCKKLAEKRTTDLSKVYDLVKELINFKIEEPKLSKDLESDFNFLESFVKEHGGSKTELGFISNIKQALLREMRTSQDLTERLLKK